jgi:hypothetical protein
MPLKIRNQYFKTTKINKMKKTLVSAAGMISAVPHKQIPGEFGLTIVSGRGAATAATRIVVNPGKFTSKADLATYGIANDGILTDGTIFTDGEGDTVTALPKVSGQTVDAFVREMLLGNFRLEGLNISTDNEDTFEQMLEFTGNAAFGKPAVERIDMTDFVDEYQANAKKANVKLAARGKALNLNRESILVWPVPGNTKMNVTFRGVWFKVMYPIN